MPTQKKKLITSALPYVNNVPHLGNIIGSVLSADVYARICRSLGYETLYICATDEYGTATENKAREEGLSPQEICDKYHHVHKDIYQQFNLSFDHFGRTSIPEHTEVTKGLYHKLNDLGCIFEQTSEQFYCQTDHIFLADRFVEGSCPHCQYDAARGDQCDNCGKMLNPTELISAKCKVCGNSPELRSTNHLYLNLPKLREPLLNFFKTASKDGHWPKNAVTVTQKWLDDDLQPRPITRDLKWGIPVPRKGYEEKVFYVWFDAVIGYISNTKQALGDRWEYWWRNPEETELYQFMAKDNIPFHTIIFPAILLGIEESWTLLHHINSTEYLNYENTKFSKSRGIGVFGDNVSETGIPIDLWRFYLLSNRPETSDSKFSWELFYEEINSNFIDNIGNLLNRLLTFFNKHFETLLPFEALEQEQQEFLHEVVDRERKIITALDKVELREGLRQILALGKIGNKFFQEQSPWKTVKTDQKQALRTLTVLSYLVRDVAALLSPFMPETSTRMFEILEFPEISLTGVGIWNDLAGLSLGKNQLLFQKLNPEDAVKMRKRFSGKQETTKPEIPLKKITLKVGKITEITKHSNAEHLYVEKIDCGDEVRTIISGLVKYHTEEELLGKKVIVVTNLTPVEIRGINSEGMVLAAVKGKKTHAIILDDQAEIGSLISVPNGVEDEPETTISINDFFATTMKIIEGGIYVGNAPLLLSGEPIRSEKILSGKVR